MSYITISSYKNDPDFDRDAAMTATNAQVTFICWNLYKSSILRPQQAHTMMQADRFISKTTTDPVRSLSSPSSLLNQTKAWTMQKQLQSSPPMSKLVTQHSGSCTTKMGRSPRWEAAVRADIKHLHHLGLLHKHGMSHRQIKNGSSRCASLIVQEILNRERIGAVTTTLCSTRFF